MYRAILFLMILLPNAILTSFEKQDCELKISEGPAPAWVRSCSFSLEPIPLKPSQVNLQYLLSDVQRNFVEKSVYYHYAIKAVSQSGVSNIAQIDVDFSPSYENIVIHEIRVYRDGAWSDRLQTARHSLLQRESELERDLYDGVFSLVYFLDDVCEGDIVEYAFSIEGEFPYFSSHLTHAFHLQGGVVFERLHRRLLASQENALNLKLFNCAIEPQVSDLSNHVREWSWELTETTPFKYEEDTPAWYMPLAKIQFSQYATWREVIEKLLPIYVLPEDFLLEPSMEMAALVQKWMEATPDPQQRALLALRFVQEKVRYLGFEEGLDGFKPHDPRDVFQSRYGDCKDKTFLLHALLRLMGIDSTPVLIHSSKGKCLPDLLPMPFAFDHIALRIEIEGSEYWVDPTFYQQGGASLRDTFFPMYYWGLPISANETGLIRLPDNRDEKPLEIETSFYLTSPDSAQVKIVRAFSGGSADYLRRYLDWKGIQNFSDDFLQFLQKTYGSASVVSPLTVADDQENNVLVVTETFEVATKKRGGKKMLKVFSLAVSYYLDSGLNPERKTPFELAYPLWVKEHIHIENPYADWVVESSDYQHEHESLFYSHSEDKGGQLYDLFSELKHLSDHVPVDSLRDYWEITNEIEQESLFSISVVTPKRTAA